MKHSKRTTQKKLVNKTNCLSVNTAIKKQHQWL